jgi:branched-chain amino acid transport system substrate-binding protein
MEKRMIKLRNPFLILIQVFLTTIFLLEPTPVAHADTFATWSNATFKADTAYLNPEKLVQLDITPLQTGAKMWRYLNVDWINKDTSHSYTGQAGISNQPGWQAFQFAFYGAVDIQLSLAGKNSGSCAKFNPYEYGGKSYFQAICTVPFSFIQGHTYRIKIFNDTTLGPTWFKASIDDLVDKTQAEIGSINVGDRGFTSPLSLVQYGMHDSTPSAGDCSKVEINDTIFSAVTSGNTTFNTFLGQSSDVCAKAVVVTNKYSLGGTVIKFGGTNPASRNLEATAALNSSVTSKIVYLAYQGPLSGPEATTGIDESAGVNWAIKRFNSSQSDYQVKLVLVDDQGDPAVAGPAARDISGKSEILGMIGPAYSGATIASLPYYKSTGLAMISPSATRISLTDPTSADYGGPVFFRVSTLDTRISEAVAEFAVKGVLSPRVFIVDDQSAYSVPAASTITSFLKKLPGASLVGRDSVPNTTTDFSPTIAKIKTSGATVVIYTGYYSQAAVFIKQLRDSGSKAVFAGGDGVFNQEFPRLAGAAAEGSRIIGIPALADVNPTLEAQFRGQMGVASGIYAIQSIDAANIFLQGIKAGKLTRAAMLEWVKNYNGVGIVGNKIKFTSYGDTVEPHGVAGFVVSNQKLVFQELLGNLAVMEPTPTPKPVTKPETPSFSLINITGNKLNVSVNLGNAGASRPDSVYLVAPKLGILDSNKLFGDVSGSKASWSIDFDKLLSGAAIPLKVVGVKNGVESEPLEQDFNAPAAVEKLLTNKSAPLPPKNVKSRIVGTSAIISAEATVKAGALATQAFVFGPSIGLAKAQAVAGDIVGNKVLLEVPLKTSMAGKKLLVTIYLSNEAGDSKPVQTVLVIPAAPKIPSGTIKLPTQTKAPKTVLCLKGSQTRTFAANSCPPGWKSA